MFRRHFSRRLAVIAAAALGLLGATGATAGATTVTTDRSAVIEAWANCNMNGYTNGWVQLTPERGYRSQTVFVRHWLQDKFGVWVSEDRQMVVGGTGTVAPQFGTLLGQVDFRGLTLNGHGQIHHWFQVWYWRGSGWSPMYQVEATYNQQWIYPSPAYAFSSTCYV